MEEKIFDVIVAGAGFAGLSAAYHLKKYGLEYVVFERGRIGESWRSQRWNSFRLSSTTGFNVDFTYIKLPVFNGDGKLIHKDGITEVAGLYFLGYHWLRSRKSPILFGILEDADFITEKIYCYSKINFESPQVA
jgi:hypothetical protein